MSPAGTRVPVRDAGPRRPVLPRGPRTASVAVAAGGAPGGPATGAAIAGGGPGGSPEPDAVDEAGDGDGGDDGGGLGGGGTDSLDEGWDDGPDEEPADVLDVALVVVTSGAGSNRNASAVPIMLPTITEAIPTTQVRRDRLGTHTTAPCAAPDSVVGV